MKYIALLIIFLGFTKTSKAQLNTELHVNSFPSTYLGFVNGYCHNIPEFDNGNLYSIGIMGLNPRAYGFIFKRSAANISNFKVYYSNSQTRFENFVIKNDLINYYAFQNTDSDMGCANGGLKIMKLHKNDLSVTDSVFFCDPSIPAGGKGYYLFNHFYVFSEYSVLYPSISPTYTKLKNIVRRLDTNLVLQNLQTIGDTTHEFHPFNVRQAGNDALVISGVDYGTNKNYPSIIKLDTLGNELWRKSYYTYNDINCTTTACYEGIEGLEDYPNGFIALFNMPFNCNFPYNRSFMAKLDKNGNIIKEMQYTIAGDTMLELNSNTTNYTYRATFEDMLIKTKEGYFASVISESDKYGTGTTATYIAVIDTNLNIIHHSPYLGNLADITGLGLAQGDDGTFYLVGVVNNSSSDGSDVRVYTYKPNGPIGINEYAMDKGIKLYPNPASSEFMIEYNAEDDNNKLFVYDCLGNLVLSESLSRSSHKHRIDLSSLSNGLYFIKLMNSNKIIFSSKLNVVR